MTDPEWRNIDGLTKEEVKAKIIPPRYDQHRPCVKCGNTAATTKFCSSRTPHGNPLDSASGFTDHILIPEDHIDRRCPNCGHEWLERTVDAPDVEVADWIRAKGDAFQEWLRYRQSAREQLDRSPDAARPWWHRKQKP